MCVGAFHSCLNPAPRKGYHYVFGPPNPPPLQHDLFQFIYIYIYDMYFFSQRPLAFLHISYCRANVPILSDVSRNNYMLKKLASAAHVAIVFKPLSFSLSSLPLPLPQQTTHEKHKSKLSFCFCCCCNFFPLPCAAFCLFCECLCSSYFYLSSSLVLVLSPYDCLTSSYCCFLPLQILETNITLQAKDYTSYLSSSSFIFLLFTQTSNHPSRFSSYNTTNTTTTISTTTTLLLLLLLVCPSLAVV